MDGMIGVWKEPGMTSFDCVAAMRKILHIRKIGHAGTLDPQVSGVLPICIGRGTKLVEFLQENGKVYQGEITLGIATETEDREGEVIARKKVVEKLSEEAIDFAMADFEGYITQIPPMYSAVKVNGKRLYQYARAHETVERPQRRAWIGAFKRTSPVEYHPDQATASWKFEVICGKGTYVRTLAVDLGKQLGYPAHMSQLTRTAAGGLTAEDCHTLDEIRKKKETDGRIDEWVLPLAAGVQHFPQFELSDELFEKVKHGVQLPAESLDGMNPGETKALFFEEKLVALYQLHPEKENIARPVKMFWVELQEQ
ncbi:tRNA pseudouridine(55) synthase TruB [Enterococcus hirae]|nr:tRNA pseudouridine(55) synthase TruB [Enterococcaceae bacterium]MCI1919951.1 tRNA pseudouridine(55) synthase TruB [Enterococcaceae bacterium]MDM8214439.1 tRNA pseudouridine(55) synthase TruB [Enterococcus hirae]